VWAHVLFELHEDVRQGETTRKLFHLPFVSEKNDDTSRRTPRTAEELLRCRLRADVISRLTYGTNSSIFKGSLKVKDFPYSLPSVGPGANPGVQAVSPQVT